MTREFPNDGLSACWPSLPADEWLNVNQSLPSITKRTTFSNWRSSAICRLFVCPRRHLCCRYLQCIRIRRQGKTSPLKWDCQSQGWHVAGMLSLRFGARFRESRLDRNKQITANPGTWRGNGLGLGGRGGRYRWWQSGVLMDGNCSRGHVWAVSLAVTFTNAMIKRLGPPSSFVFTWMFSLDSASAILPLRPCTSVV